MTTAIADFEEPVSPTTEEAKLALESSQRLAKRAGTSPHVSRVCVLGRVRCVRVRVCIRGQHGRA
jgi:hypothetical protein